MSSPVTHIVVKLGITNVHLYLAKCELCVYTPTKASLATYICS